MSRAIAFSTGFFAPNRLRVADPLVPRRAYEQPIPAVAPDKEELASAAQYVRYLDALHAIQQYADEEIFVPEPTSMDTAAYASIMRAAKLLAGETVEFGWNELTIILKPNAPLIEDGNAHALVADIPLVVQVGSQQIVLGFVRHSVEAAEIASRIESPDGTMKVVMRPALGKTQAKAFWAGPDSIDHIKDRMSQ